MIGNSKTADDSIREYYRKQLIEKPRWNDEDDEDYGEEE